MNYKIVVTEIDTYQIYEQDPADGSWRLIHECFFRENANLIVQILEFDDCGIPNQMKATF